MANKTKNKHAQRNTAASLPSTPVGAVSTGASSHTDPGSYRNDESNPAQDLDLSPQLQPAAQPRSSWIEGVNQLPQQLKAWGSKAADQVSSLSTTQKVVGGALLLGGIGWLSWRAKGNSVSSEDNSYDAAQSARPWGSAGRTAINEQLEPVNSYRNGLAGDTVLN